MARTTTVVTVAYRTHSLDLSWVPRAEAVIVVHNDDMLAPHRVAHDHVTHLLGRDNVGFGAAVNRALRSVETDRVLLVNPDVHPSREHWRFLSGGGPDELRTCALRDPDGHATSQVNRYPTPASLLLTGYRVGRLVGRRSRVARLLGPRLGRWGREHEDLMEVTEGEWPLTTHWVSGALVSLPVEPVRAVGGFDDEFFLYLEDVDLCRRLAAHDPALRIVMGGPPAEHEVSASADDRRAVDRHYLASAFRYARLQDGRAWQAARAALLPRRALLR